MKRIKYFMITGMLLASIGLAGCGKKAEDDITNKEIYQDDLEPLTEDELNEMDADTSDEDMKQIEEPDEEGTDSTDTTDATETMDNQISPEIKKERVRKVLELSSDSANSKFNASSSASSDNLQNNYKD